MKTLLILFLSFTIPFNLIAQKQGFDAGVLLGINFSELEGNGLLDYYGLNAGLLGNARFSDRLQLGVEFLFSQNGEYVAPEFYPNTDYGKVWLNHLEIPVHIDVLLDWQKKKPYAEWDFQFGLAYALLLTYRVKDDEGQDLTEQIRYKNHHGILGQVGTTYFFTKNIGLNLKATWPISEKNLEWTIAGRLVYLLGGRV